MKVLSDISELKEYFTDENLFDELGGTSKFKYSYPDSIEMLIKKTTTNNPAPNRTEINRSGNIMPAKAR